MQRRLHENNDGTKSIIRIQLRLHIEEEHVFRYSEGPWLNFERRPFCTGCGVLPLSPEYEARDEWVTRHHNFAVVHGTPLFASDWPVATEVSHEGWNTQQYGHGEVLLGAETERLSP